MKMLLGSVVLAALVLGGSCGGSSTTSPKASPSAVAAKTVTATTVAAPTTIPSPAPTEAPLLKASAKDLVTSADVPADWYDTGPDPGSALADASSYSACGPGPTVPLDAGFTSSATGPSIGETIQVLSSTAAARTALTTAISHATSCTKNDNVGSTTSIKTSPQSLAGTYGDESQAVRVDEASGGGAALGYVVVVRKSNVVFTFFYLDLHGGDGLPMLEPLVARAVDRIGT